MQAVAVEMVGGAQALRFAARAMEAVAVEMVGGAASGAEGPLHPAVLGAVTAEPPPLFTTMPPMLAAAPSWGVGRRLAAAADGGAVHEPDKVKEEEKEDEQPGVGAFPPPVSSTGALGSAPSAAAAAPAAAAHTGAARPRSRGAKRQRQGKSMAPKQVSKAMSRLLRHPNQDVHLDPDGTTSAGLLRDVIGCELADVHTAVGQSSHRGAPRFELVGTGVSARVRATGGHTVVVDISQPLHILYPDM